MLIACDGSSLKNGDPKSPSGWAWARDDGAWMSNGMIGGSNNRAELHALWSVLAFHQTGELTIQMDSQYALNIAEKWAFGWEKRGWVKADKQPIQNLDIVQAITLLRHRRKDPIIFEWVKGHGKGAVLSPLNEAADLRAGEDARRAREAGEDSKDMFYLDSKGRLTTPHETHIFKKLYANRLNLVTTPK